MRAVMFRKVEVDGVLYYQLFNDIEGFDPKENEDEVTDFDHRGEKTYFYIDGDSDMEIPDPSLLNIYYDDPEKGFTNVIDSATFLKVFEVFKKEFNVVIKEIKPIDDVVDSVSKKIMFQEEVISQLVQRIYLNQSFVISDLPIELKQYQKPNILFHGLSGSGKETIINCLEEELGIPYVEVTLNSSVRDTLEQIIKTLLERSHTDEEASCGIVYIKDNFEEMTQALGDEESVYKIIDYLTSQEVLTYDGHKIDFRTLTFVVLFNDDEHDMTFNAVQRLINCDLELTTRNLSDGEKYEVLLSDNGIIKHYEKFLNHYGNEFLIDEECLMKLIEKCSQINPSMEAVNRFISAIVSYSTYNGITDVLIDQEHMEVFNAIVDQQLSEVPQKQESKEKIEKFLFEKKVDALFNEAKKYFIGQDKNLRLFITNVLNNLNVAEDKGLYSPQSYKLNILVRGSTGSGKTFLVDTVCKLTGAPYVSVDATKFTETGYFGNSIDEIFISLIHAAGGNVARAEKGIVYIDEIDKKTDSTGDRSKAMTKAVLHELLKPAEGTTLRLNIGTSSNPEYVDFDTSRVTFICGGAFFGIEEFYKKRTGEGGIGFGKHDKKINPGDITKDDYIAYGMPAEFMRRVKSFINLNDPTKESILDIMKSSELSALRVAKYQFGLREIDLEFTEGFCEKIAEKALERKEGISGVGNILEEIFQKINHQDIRSSKIEKIILNDEVISDPSKVVLIERGKQKKKKIGN